MGGLYKTVGSRSNSNEQTEELTGGPVSVQLDHHFGMVKRSSQELLDESALKVNRKAKKRARAVMVSA